LLTDINVINQAISFIDKSKIKIKQLSDNNTKEEQDTKEEASEEATSTLSKVF